MRKVVILIGLVVGVISLPFMFAIGAEVYWRIVSVTQLNDASPEYIKQVTAYKEGMDGILIYFSLADRSGVRTTADGMVKVRVVEQNSLAGMMPSQAKENVLASTDYTVSKGDFRMAEIGLGALCRVCRLRIRK